MDNTIPKKLSYFPGCSLATTAKENNQSLINFCASLGIELVELEDWNCCGSSSAHSINSDLAFNLAAGNLALAPEKRPLLVACPSCTLRLSQAQLHLQQEKEKRKAYEKEWHRPVDDNLEILQFFELLDRINRAGMLRDKRGALKGLKFVPYYGCMLAQPPEMHRRKNFHGIMERVLSSLGAEPVSWAYPSRCCGTFLSVVRPDVVTPMVNEIVNGAKKVKADCMVTACAMCHLNLEVRCNLKEQVPILHFSEILSLAMGEVKKNNWFARHLVDPRPVLKSKGLLP